MADLVHLSTDIIAAGANATVDLGATWPEGAALHLVAYDANGIPVNFHARLDTAAAVAITNASPAMSGLGLRDLAPRRLPDAGGALLPQRYLRLYAAVNCTVVTSRWRLP
jgi:hypothetical protein